jgi:peptidoglycan hydrolase-like protein with peptidoglycan-binding domain
MALLSRLFRDNRELSKCQYDDSAHVTLGARGHHVRLIQTALVNLGYGRINGVEFLDGRYGATTANAVLRYKTARNIVNLSYQRTPDNIVGKLTVSRLDQDLLSIQDAPKKHS